MATYEELKKRAKSEQGSTQTTSSYEELKKRAKQEKFDEDVKKVDSSYIDLFINSTNDFFSSVKEESENVGWDNAYITHQNRASKKADLDYRHSVIRSWLDNNRDSLDDGFYEEFSGYLDSYSSNSPSVVDWFKNSSDYYSQFKSADHYFQTGLDTKARQQRQDWWQETETKLKTLEEINKEYTQLTNTANSSAPAYANGRYSPGHNSRNPGGQNRVTPVGYTGADNEYSKQAAELPLYIGAERIGGVVMPLQPGQQRRVGAAGEERLRHGLLHMQPLRGKVPEKGEFGFAQGRAVVNLQPLRGLVDAQQIPPVHPVGHVLIVPDEPGLRAHQPEGGQRLRQQRVHSRLLSMAAMAQTMPSTAADMMPPA